MSKHLNVANHLTELELRARAEAAKDPNERMRWVAILQNKAGKAATFIADFCNRQPDWVRRVVRAYNELGPDSVTDGRTRNGTKGGFTQALQAEPQAAPEHESPPGGGLWNGPKVARWVSKRTGDIVHPRTGWAYLKKLNWSIKVPLPTHPDSDEGAKEAFKKGG